MSSPSLVALPTGPLGVSVVKNKSDGLCVVTSKRDDKGDVILSVNGIELKDMEGGATIVCFFTRVSNYRGEKGWSDREKLKDDTLESQIKRLTTFFYKWREECTDESLLLYSNVFSVRSMDRKDLGDSEEFEGLLREIKEMSDALPDGKEIVVVSLYPNRLGDSVEEQDRNRNRIIGSGARHVNFLSLWDKDWESIKEICRSAEESRKKLQKPHVAGRMAAFVLQGAGEDFDGTDGKKIQAEIDSKVAATKEQMKKPGTDEHNFVVSGVDNGGLLAYFNATASNVGNRLQETHLQRGPRTSNRASQSQIQSTGFAITDLKTGVLSYFGPEGRCTALLTDLV